MLKYTSTKLPALGIEPESPAWEAGVEPIVLAVVIYNFLHSPLVKCNVHTVPQEKLRPHTDLNTQPLGYEAYALSTALLGLM